MPQKESVIQDPQLGEIRLSPNARARRFIFRAKEGRIECTCPPRATLKETREAIERLRPKLKKMLERETVQQEARFIGPDFRIEAEEFTFHLEEARVSRMTVRQRRGELVCYYPSGQNFTPQHVQDWLRKVVEESLRQHAKVLFPPRLKEMAQARGLCYQSVSIHKTKGRWGSCSTRKNINLSLYLMLLPRRLQDLVMQHELTHLVEMNHGPRFHALLDKVMAGRTQELERELKKYKTEI